MFRVLLRKLTVFARSIWSTMPESVDLTVSSPEVTPPYKVLTITGASEYFKRTENIAGVKDMRFQALMPDILHWLGIKKIDRMLSMSK